MLGSRKLLIFAAVFAVALSLFVVCASAEEVELELVDLEVRSSPVRTSGQPLYKVEYSSSSVINDFLVEGGYTSTNNPCFVGFPLYLNRGGADVTVTGLYSHSGTVSTRPDGYDFTDGRYLWSDSPEFYSWLVDTVGMSTSDIVVARQGTFLGMAFEVFMSILGIGSSLVAFVIARPIVLIPIVAMVFVLGYGVIRRLVKGV